MTIIITREGQQFVSCRDARNRLEASPIKASLVLMKQGLFQYVRNANGQNPKKQEGGNAEVVDHHSFLKLSNAPHGTGKGGTDSLRVPQKLIDRQSFAFYYRTNG